jgi:hypothetical protein
MWRAVSILVALAACSDSQCPQEPAIVVTGNLLMSDGTPVSVFNVWSAGEGCPSDLAKPCALVSGSDDSSRTTYWVLPSEPGSYDLRELDATICDAGAVCSAVAGTFTVESVMPPCSDGTCGHVDADLTIVDGTAMTSGHVVYDTVLGACSDGSHMFGLD